MGLQIGTASFGNKYGILNSQMLNNKSEIKSILEYCSQKKIILDSSPNYGLSLKYINMLSKDIKSTINTKIIIGKYTLREFEVNLIKHLDSLNNCAINTIYFHEPKASHNSKFPEILEITKQISAKYNVKYIGLSIYKPDDFKSSNFSNNSINCIQIPINILDKNNLNITENLKNISLVGRSIFLQGLLTSKGINLLSNSSNKKDIKNASLISKLAKKFNTNIETLAIASVINHPQIESIIIGINSLKQFNEIIRFYGDAKILAKELKYVEDLYEGIESDGSTFERWLPFLSGQKSKS